MINQTRMLEVVKFLEREKKWNAELQELEYLSIMSTANSNTERLRHLLYAMANSQSQPKIDQLAKFWYSFEKSWTRSEPAWKKGIPLVKLVDFLRKQSTNKSKSCTELIEQTFENLKSCMGFGPKTAALFVKALVKIHRGSNAKLYFLDANSIEYVRNLNDEKLQLPVDAVITKIFEGMTFKKINMALFKFIETPEISVLNLSKIELMILLDDLWFWGYFTQKKDTKGQRITRWNKNKYLVHKFTRKSESEMKNIALKMKEFIALTKGLTKRTKRVSIT